MIWKNLPNWLKGGIIGLVIGAILSLIEVLCYSTCDSFGCVVCGFPTIIGAVLSYPLSWFGQFSDNLLFFFVFPVFNIIGLIIICALIGWIMGKIKSKNQNEVEK
jgi:uncharacterized membrane protein YeaQ/YmgE (transglycosylase-associated protein family)